MQYMHIKEIKLSGRKKIGFERFFFLLFLDTFGLWAGTMIFFLISDHDFWTDDRTGTLMFSLIDKFDRIFKICMKYSKVYTHGVHKKFERTSPVFPAYIAIILVFYTFFIKKLNYSSNFFLFNDFFLVN